MQPFLFYTAKYSHEDFEKNFHFSFKAQQHPTCQGSELKNYASHSEKRVFERELPGKYQEQQTTLTASA